MAVLRVPKTFLKRNYSKYAREIDFSIAMTINKALFESKIYFSRLMETAYHLGAVRWTGQQIQYTKATKQAQHGMLFIRHGGLYIIPTIDGGTIKKFPGTSALIQPVKGNVALSKQGNLKKGYLDSKKTNPKYFTGYPKGRAKTDENYGLWRRTGRKGREGLKLEVSLKDQSRKQKRIFDGRKLARMYAHEMFKKHFVKELARAAHASQQRAK